MATEDSTTVVVIDGYKSTLVPSTSSSAVASAMSRFGNDEDNINVFAGAASGHKYANEIIRTVTALLLLPLVTWVSSCVVS